MDGRWERADCEVQIVPARGAEETDREVAAKHRDKTDPADVAYGAGRPSEPALGQRVFRSLHQVHRWSLGKAITL